MCTVSSLDVFRGGVRETAAGPALTVAVGVVRTLRLFGEPRPFGAGHQCRVRVQALGHLVADDVHESFEHGLQNTRRTITVIFVFSRVSNRFWRFVELNCTDVAFEFPVEKREGADRKPFCSFFEQISWDKPHKRDNTACWNHFLFFFFSGISIYLRILPETIAHRLRFLTAQNCIRQYLVDITARLDDEKLTKLFRINILQSITAILS